MKGNRKTVTLAFRVTKQEARAILLLAARESIKPSEYMRRLLSAECKRLELPPLGLIELLVEEVPNAPGH